jgi:hypothetical protein
LLIEHEFRVPVTWVCPWDPDQDGRSDDLVALEQLQIDLASCLNPLAYAMLLSYGNTAMRDVIIKGGGQGSAQSGGASRSCYFVHHPEHCDDAPESCSNPGRKLSPGSDFFHTSWVIGFSPRCWEAEWLKNRVEAAEIWPEAVL